MAITNFQGGHLLAAAGDVLVERMAVTTVLLKKTTSNGTVTLGDGDNTEVLTTPTLTTGNVIDLVFSPPWDTNGVSIKAISGGGAELTVFHSGEAHKFEAPVLT